MLLTVALVGGVEVVAAAVAAQDHQTHAVEAVLLAVLLQARLLGASGRLRLRLAAWTVRPRAGQQLRDADLLPQGRPRDEACWWERKEVQPMECYWSMSLSYLSLSKLAFSLFYMENK